MSEISNTRMFVADLVHRQRLGERREEQADAHCAAFHENQRHAALARHHALSMVEHAFRGRLLRSDPSALPPALCQDWWLSVADLIQDFENEPLLQSNEAPLHLLSILRGFAGMLATGKIPVPVSGVINPLGGRSGPDPSEVKHIRHAVTYKGAVDEGSIVDPHPTKTIRDLFGVTAQTVQKWCKTYQPFDYDPDPKAIFDRMKISGAAYARNQRRSNKRGTWTKKSPSRKGPI